MQHHNNLQRDYESLIPTIKHLSLAAQFVSGATAAIGIYVVIFQKMPIAIKIAAIIASLALTFIIVGSFEGGIRKLFPYWVRQLLNWFFAQEQESMKPRRIRVVLFIMLCIMLLPLLLGTTIASWKASPELVAYTTPPPPSKDLEQVASSADQSTQQLITQFDQDFQRATSQFEVRQEAERARWQSKIDAQQSQYDRYVRLNNQGHKWAGGVASKIKSETIPKLKTQMNEALQQLAEVQASSMDSLRQVKQVALLREQENKTTLLQSAQTYNQNNLLSTQGSIEKWGGFLAIIAVIATFFTLFCLSFIEAYKAGILPDGTGVTPSIPDKSAVPGWLKSFWTHKTPSQYVAHHTHTPDETLVPQNTQPRGTNSRGHTHNLGTPTHTITREIETDYVSIDKLIKRTRQQYKRSKDNDKSSSSRAANARKAAENIALLRSLGVQVEENPDEQGKLIIYQREVG